MFDSYINANINKILEFIYRDKTNVQLDICDYTSNKWGHRTSNKRFK